jgi:hypothetical protein
MHGRCSASRHVQSSGHFAAWRRVSCKSNRSKVQKARSSHGKCTFDARVSARSDARSLNIYTAEQTTRGWSSIACDDTRATTRRCALLRRRAPAMHVRLIFRTRRHAKSRFLHATIRGLQGHVSEVSGTDAPGRMLAPGLPSTSRRLNQWCYVGTTHRSKVQIARSSHGKMHVRRSCLRAARMHGRCSASRHVQSSGHFAAWRRVSCKSNRSKVQIARSTLASPRGAMHARLIYILQSRRHADGAPLHATIRGLPRADACSSGAERLRCTLA